MFFIYSSILNIYPVGFPLFFQFSVTGSWGGDWAGFFLRAGLVTGLQVGRALGCSGCLGLGSAIPVPYVRGQPTSICDEGVNSRSESRRQYSYTE